MTSRSSQQPIKSPSTLCPWGGVRTAAALVVAGLLTAGCSGRLGTEIAPPIELEIPNAIIIPAGNAHTKFQHGRQAMGVSRYDPWCELEIETVSDQQQTVEPGRFKVRRVQQAFISNYDTRMPAFLAGLGCSDLVFQETVWWVVRQSVSGVRTLRCLAPYVNCRFGPPLSPWQIQEVVGPKIRVDVGAAPRAQRGEASGR